MYANLYIKHPLIKEIGCSLDHFVCLELDSTLQLSHSCNRPSYYKTLTIVLISMMSILEEEI